MKRKEKNGTHTTLNCPTAIVTYNRHMAGVDHGDQLRWYYQLRLKCMKYYKYIFWFIVDVSITNAYILHSRFCVPADPTAENLRLKQFRLHLAQSLIGDYYSRQKTGRPCNISMPLPQPVTHSPSHFPLKPSQKRQCAYCNYSRHPPCGRESRWYCGDCEGNPTLCLTGMTDERDCWRLWHSAQ